MGTKTATTNTAPVVNMALARSYAALVKAGRRTIESVPAAYREIVETLTNA